MILWSKVRVEQDASYVWPCHLLVTYCHPLRRYIQYPSTETDGLVQRTFEIMFMMR